MKQLLKHIIAISIVATAPSSQLFAQFGITPATGGAFGRTNPAGIAGVGIGNFPNGTPTAAALHVNSNLTGATAFFNRGEIFRTDAPNWRKN